MNPERAVENTLTRARIDVAPDGTPTCSNPEITMVFFTPIAPLGPIASMATPGRVSTKTLFKSVKTPACEAENKLCCNEVAS
jgi:hypothetical protein